MVVNSRFIDIDQVGSGEESYESFATVGEIRVWWRWRADFQSGSRVLKKVF